MERSVPSTTALRAGAEPSTLKPSLATSVKLPARLYAFTRQ